MATNGIIEYKPISANLGDPVALIGVANKGFSEVGNVFSKIRENMLEEAKMEEAKRQFGLNLEERQLDRLQRLQEKQLDRQTALDKINLGHQNALDLLRYNKEEEAKKAKVYADALDIASGIRFDRTVKELNNEYNNSDLVKNSLAQIAANDKQDAAIQKEYQQILQENEMINKDLSILAPKLDIIVQNDNAKALAEITKNNLSSLEKIASSSGRVSPNLYNIAHDDTEERDYLNNWLGQNNQRIKSLMEERNKILKENENIRTKTTNYYNELHDKKYKDRLDAAYPGQDAYTKAALLSRIMAENGYFHDPTGTLEGKSVLAAGTSNGKLSFDQQDMLNKNKAMYNHMYSFNDGNKDKESKDFVTMMVEFGKTNTGNKDYHVENLEHSDLFNNFGISIQNLFNTQNIKLNKKDIARSMFDNLTNGSDNKLRFSRFSFGPGSNDLTLDNAKVDLNKINELVERFKNKRLTKDEMIKAINLSGISEEGRRTLLRLVNQAKFK